MSGTGTDPVPRYFTLRPLSEVTPRNTRFLLPGMIPLRTLTLIAGVGGLGKSTWLASVAARLSRGELTGEPAATIIVSFEDAPEEVLVPRIAAAGGDLTRIFDLRLAGDTLVDDPVSFPGDLAEVSACARDAEAKLVIVDPIVAAIDVSFDTHKDQHVRSVLAGLAVLAEEEELAVTIVGHLNKAPSKEAYLRVANSVAFWNASRSVVLVTEDPEEPESHRIIAQRKANYSRLARIERHRIEEIVLPDKIDPDTGRPITTSRMVFVEHAEDVNGDDLLAPRERSGPKVSAATSFLASALADGEWHDSAGLKELAAASGIKERTLIRAATDEIGVEDKREGFPSITFWRAPSRANPYPLKVGTTREAQETSGIDARSEPSRATDLGTGTTGTTRDTANGDDTTSTKGDEVPGKESEPQPLRPGPGDEMYPVLLAEAVRDGHITLAEAEKRYALHKLVVAAEESAAA